MAPDNDTQVMTDLVSVSSAAAYLIGLWNGIYREGTGHPFGGGPKIPANGSDFSVARFNSAIAAFERAPAFAATISATITEGVRTMLEETSAQPVERPPQLTCKQLRQLINLTEAELAKASGKEKSSLEATLGALQAQAKNCPE